MRLGLLGEGDQRPTVGDVAKVTINPNTVLKAQREPDLSASLTTPPRPAHG
jgi:hypothetical protein